MVFLSDPGYYDSFYRTERTEEPVDEACIKALEAARDALPDNELAQQPIETTKTRYDIYDKLAIKMMEKEYKETMDDIESGLASRLL